MSTMAIPGAQTASAGTGGWCQGLSTGAPVIDALGDSLTDGGSVSAVDQRWTSELGASLRSGGYPGTQIWTGGAIPGSATADYVSGAKYSGHIEFTSHQPNLITLGWGTNDWAGGINPQVFKAQYQQIITRIKALSPDSTLLIIHMPWVYNQSLTSTRGDQGDYLQAEKELAQANGARFFGAEWYFPGDDPFLFKTSDGVHMTALGQWVFYSAIRGYLLGMC
jgi:lysophospholipase L1-like esterase